MDIRKILAELLGMKESEIPEGSDFEGFSDEQVADAEKAARDKLPSLREARDLEGFRVAVESIEAIVAERTQRSEAAAEMDKQFNDLDAKVKVETDTSDDGDEGSKDSGSADDSTSDSDDSEDSDKADTPASETVPVATAEDKTPVAADAKPDSDKPDKKAEKKAVVRTVPKPSTIPDTQTPLRLVAAADVKNHSAGMEIKPDRLHEAFFSKAESVTMSKTRGRWPVAALEWGDEYPADRQLSKSDSETNTAKINKVVADGQAHTFDVLQQILTTNVNSPEMPALLAAGGLCAPVNVRYDIFTVGTERRPLRDALARFAATRGGIRFNAPPTLASVDVGAVQITTVAQDASSSEYPKDCLRIECGADTEVNVQSISLCMEVGVWSQLFFPENFRAWWGLGRVWHARTAEDTLWDRMVTLSTAVTAGEAHGAARDTLAQVERAATQFRGRHRIDPNTPLRLYAPFFLANMMRVDLARNAPGDNNLAVSDAQIAQFFAARNIAVTFVLDGQSAGGTSGDTQGANALNPWPGTVDTILTIDSTFLYLDGGSLNFGTEIRDFDQIRNNDLGAFMENFENVAFVGPESLRLRLDICPDGSTGGEDEDAVSCVVGS